MSLIVQSYKEIMARVQQIQDDWTVLKGYDLVVEVDNDNAVDESAQRDPYLKVQVKYPSADQLDLGIDPNTKQYGQLLFSACVRCGQGTIDAKELLDFVSRYFAMEDLATVRFHTFQAAGHKEVKGWWYENGILNFWYIWRKSE